MRGFVFPWAVSFLWLKTKPRMQESNEKRFAFNYEFSFTVANYDLKDVRYCTI